MNFIFDNQTVSRLIGDMNNYCREIGEAFSAIKNSCDNAGEQWKDSKKSEFEQLLYELIGNAIQGRDALKQYAAHLADKAWRMGN